MQVKTRWRKINFQEIAGIKGHRIFEYSKQNESFLNFLSICTINLRKFILIKPYVYCKWNFIGRIIHFYVSSSVELNNLCLKFSSSSILNISPNNVTLRILCNYFNMRGNLFFLNCRDIVRNNHGICGRIMCSISIPLSQLRNVTKQWLVSLCRATKITILCCRNAGDKRIRSIISERIKEFRRGEIILAERVRFCREREIKRVIMVSLDKNYEQAALIMSENNNVERKEGKKEEKRELGRIILHARR